MSKSKFRVWCEAYAETRATGIDVEAETIGLAAVAGQERCDWYSCDVETQPIEWMVFTPLEAGDMAVCKGRIAKVTVRGKEGVVTYEHGEVRDVDQEQAK